MNGQTKFLRLVRTHTGECLQVRRKCAADQESEGKHLRPEQDRKTTELPHEHHREDTTPALHKPVSITWTLVSATFISYRVGKYSS